MTYCFQVLPHANLHYQEALVTLAKTELSCMLSSLGLACEVGLTSIGGQAFLQLDTSAPLDEASLARLSAHSALLLMCEQQGELLRPLARSHPRYLPQDLSEVLKYKGKTSAVFTRMMINCAHAASDFFGEDRPLLLLDPMCGKATTPFCALERGWNAIGLDTDLPALEEADRHMVRWLKLHKLKHQRAEVSLTLRGRGVPSVQYQTADTREHYVQGDTRSLRLIHSDTALCGELLKKTPVDLIVSDLPYGIQHAPVDGRKPEPFTSLMARALPAWRQILKHGGAMALSFNTYTLPREKLLALCEQAGFEPLNEPPYHDFSHFVEQAVVRDVVVARNP